MTTAHPPAAMNAVGADTRRPARPILNAVGFCAAATLLFWPTVASMAHAWMTSSSYHHGVAVAPIALWLIARAGAPNMAARVWPPAFIAMAIACLIWLIGHAATVNLIEQIAFVSLLTAGIALFFGPAYVRHWAFPLGFLYFMIPLGGSLLPHLQSTAATSVAPMLTASGVAASLDGFIITTSGGRFNIAEACAGLNFLIAAVMIAALYSHLAIPKFTKAIGFVAIAAMFALAANFLRAYFVILAATLSEGRIAIGADHFLVGLIFYGALVGVLIPIGRFIAGPDKIASQTTRPRRLIEFATPAGTIVTAASAAILVLTAAYGRFVVDSAPASAAPSFLPLINAPGWRPLRPSPDWQAPLSHADRVLRAKYQSGIEAVQVNAAYFTHDRRGGEIAGSDTRSFDGKTWRRTDNRTAYMLAFGDLRRVSIETLENETGISLSAITFYWLGEEIYTDLKSVKLRQARQRLLGRQDRGGAIFIVSQDTPTIRGAASIEVFLQSMEPIAEWLKRIDAKAAE